MKLPFMDWNPWVKLLLITLFCFCLLSPFPWAAYASLCALGRWEGWSLYVCVNGDEGETISIVEHNYWRIYVVEDNLARLGLGKSHLHEGEDASNSNHPVSSEIGRDKRMYTLLRSALHPHTYSCHWWLVWSGLEGPVPFNSSKELWYHIVSDFPPKVYFRYSEFVLVPVSDSVLFEFKVFINKTYFIGFSKWKYYFPK